MIDFTTTNPTNTCPAPQGGLRFIVAGRMILNLAQVNAIELGATSRVAADTGIEAAVVYFASGDKRCFFGDDAMALRTALQSSEFRTLCASAVAGIVDDDTLWMNAARSLEVQP